MAQGVPGRLRPRIILTFRHYKGGRSSAKSTGRLYLRRNPWYSLSEAESTSGHMVLSGVPRKKSPVTPPGIDPGTVRLVAQRLNHHATPGHPKHVEIDKYIYTKNKLCTKLVLFTRLYRDAWSTKRKIHFSLLGKDSLQLQHSSSWTVYV